MKARFCLALAILLLSGAAHAESAAERGERALAASRYDEVKAAVAEARKAGEAARADLLDANLALVTGRYDDALKLARKAARETTLARRAIPVAAESLVRSGRRREALQELERLAKDDEAYRAHLALGELYIELGRRADADGVLMQVVEAYNSDRIRSDDAEGLALVGRAAFLLRHAEDANKLYAEAEAASRTKSPELLRWRTELFLDKYDPGHAASAIRDALALAPRDPRLRVTKAHVLLDQAMDFAAAEAEVKAALDVDPKLAEAHFIRAGLALRTMDLEAADAALRAGLTFDPDNLELLSIAAATRFLADDTAGLDALEKRVLAVNPSYARFYIVIGEFAEWEHRYDEIVALMRRAVRVDPGEAKAYAALGLNLIRAGEDAEGLEALRKAFALDDFNVRVFNTLNFYERTVAKDYVTVDGARFRIRYHRDERAVLERYLPRMLDQAWASMVGRYGFTPTEPVGIELYADPEHFSVRTSGLPNVGIQGVCFGKTLAALSPGAASFNWGMIVWHELSHVFHIQQSKSHVPRWFTEGLAEYETLIARPEWRREEEPSLYDGLRRARLPGIGHFNRAFTHVDSAADVVMAYFAASQVQVFSAERFGFDRFPRMLSGWASGRRTDQLVREVYGVDVGELDRQYRAWQEPRLARYAKQFVPDASTSSVEDAQAALALEPKNGARHAALARALFAAGKADEAEVTLKVGLAVDPRDANALFLQLKLALGRRDTPRAEAAVASLLAAGHDGYAVRMKAADVAEAKGDKDGLRAALHAAHGLDPSQAEPLQGLYDLAKKRGDEEEQLFTLRALAKLDQHDRRVWRRLLALLVRRGLWDEAVHVGESAMFVDVMHPETHVDYARALARTGRQVSAIFELNSALAARPDPALGARIYAMLAEGYRHLGRAQFAAEAERHAKTLAASPKPASAPEE